MATASAGATSSPWRMMSRNAKCRVLGRRTIAGDARLKRTRDAELAREEAREPQRLAIALSPAASGGECDDRARAAALGELQRERTPHRVPDEVRGVHAELVEVVFERVGGALKAQRARRRVRRAAVVAGQRRCDHFVARDQIAEQRAPVVPGTGETVQQHDRLAGAGTVQGWRDSRPRRPERTPSPLRALRCWSI